MVDVALAGQRVLIREDLNVPVVNGVVTSDARIRAALPTLRLAPPGRRQSLRDVASGSTPGGRVRGAVFIGAGGRTRLAGLLGAPVQLRKDWLAGLDCEPGQLVLCENVRFNKGEKKDQEELSRAMAALCDVFVMDAFAPPIAPRPAPTAWRVSRRLPAPARCSWVNSKRWSRRSRSRRGRWWRLSQARKSPPSSPCWNLFWTRSTS